MQNTTPTVGNIGIGVATGIACGSGTAGIMVGTTAALSPPLANLGGYATAQILAPSFMAGPAMSSAIATVGGPLIAGALAATGIGLIAGIMVAGMLDSLRSHLNSANHDANAVVSLVHKETRT